MSTATLAPDIQEHRIPPGAQVLEPKCCENCPRTFYRWKDSGQRYCMACRMMYQSEANQIWACWFCGTERNWGGGSPEETRNRRLKCVSCADVTEHRFARLSKVGEPPR